MDVNKVCFAAIESWDLAELYCKFLQWRTDSGIAKALEP
jgi:hypothetical protein